MSYPADRPRTRCGRCHTCGAELRKVLDGEQWCPVCGAYRRYRCHGWAAGYDPDTSCPDWQAKGEEQCSSISS